MKVNSSCAIELKQNICVSVYLCMCTCVYLLVYVTCVCVFVHEYLRICICVFVRVNRKEGEPCSKVNESCASKSKQRAPKLTWNIHGWDILSHIQTANIPTPQNKNHQQQQKQKSKFNHQLFPTIYGESKGREELECGFYNEFYQFKIYNLTILHFCIFIFQWLPFPHRRTAPRRQGGGGARVLR